MTVSPVEPPPEAFNFAAHLLQANAGRLAKASVSSTTSAS